MKDAVATMGAILPDDAGGRDAVHVAVISAIAGHGLLPSDDVGFVEINGQGEHTAVANVTPLLGIVDPFIKGRVKMGQRFWLYLYPRTITGLSHRWTHPAFPDDTGMVYGTPRQRLAAEQWIRNFVARSDSPGYEELMANAAAMADAGGDEYGMRFGHDCSGEIPDEFWVKAEIVLGRPIPGKRPTYFSCAC